MSLRARLVLATTAATAVVVLLAGIGLIALLQHDERSALDARLRSQSQVVGRPATLGTSVAQRRLVVLEGRAVGGVETRVTAGGRTLFESPTFPAIPVQRGARGYETVSVDQGSWRLLSVSGATRTAAGLRLPVTMQFAASLEPIDTAVATVRGRVLLLGAAAVLVAGAIAWGLSGVVLEPLRQLSDHAEQVSETADLTVRVPGGGPAEVAEVATSLNRMLERLEAETARTAAALEASRAFAANAAHELRTPLTSMQTNLDVLERNPGLDDATRAAVIADIAAQQGRLLGVLEALRLLARGDLGLRDLQTPVDMAGLADGAVAQARGRFPGVTFERAGAEAGAADETAGAAEGVPAADDATLQGWSEGLRVMLDNLLRNAATHGQPPDGAERAPVVTLTVAPATDAVTVHVDDNGPGIAPDERERVFERFSRGSTAAPGSGLGLALVAQQAALHGGDVTASESPSGGARITVRLPRAAPADGAAAGDR